MKLWKYSKLRVKKMDLGWCSHYND